MEDWLATTLLSSLFTTDAHPLHLPYHSFLFSGLQVKYGAAAHLVSRPCCGNSSSYKLLIPISLFPTLTPPSFQASKSNTGRPRTSSAGTAAATAGTRTLSPEMANEAMAAAALADVMLQLFPQVRGVGGVGEQCGTGASKRPDC